MSIDQVNVEEEGIKFPTKNDNSDITENPATFLELPKQTSKTTTGRKDVICRNSTRTWKHFNILLQFVIFLN